MVKEATFKSAVDWLAATDQGVEDGISLCTSILQRCTENYEPFDSMHIPISRGALVLNTDDQFCIADTESDVSSFSDESEDRPMGNVDHDTVSTTGKRFTSIPISIAQSQLKQAQLVHNHGFHLANMSVRKLKLSLREKRILFLRKTHTFGGCAHW
ncbi:hypothetical protein PHMEG_00015669 [Phytophthora megakarya]|uniref:Uncharacterized protein n=1 Tax=Phytophthora megakarya TaxID=4795 RepID=A0A225W0U7_9STRA|nr:hypothetical protein PHMEG_00015669 [Phytophthora megakarya]